MDDKQIDTAKKMLTLAMDPACHDGEALAAIKRLRMMLQAAKSKIDVIWDHERQMSSDVKTAWRQKMTFGKYEGWTLGAIYEENPEYIEWMASTLKSRKLKAMATAILEEFGYPSEESEAQA